MFDKSWKKWGGAISPPLVIAADAPATNKTFRMSAPITLPIANSPCHFLAAVTAVTNSGNEVPNATRVAAIIL